MPRCYPPVVTETLSLGACLCYNSVDSEPVAIGRYSCAILSRVLSYNQNFRNLRLRISPELREKFFFIIVGGSCATCYIGLASALHYLGLSPPVSSAWAYALCLPLGYFGQRSITFRSSRRHGAATLAYFTVQGFAVLIVTAVTFVSAEWLRHPPIVAFLVAGMIAASASYLMQKYWVFRR
jgi:putative flippase GtrA